MHLSRVLIAGAAAAVLALAAPAAGAADPAEFAGQNVAEVRLFRDGRPVDEPSLLDFIETRPGRPLSMRQVRESLTHLFSLGEYVDVRASAARGTQGVSLRYDLVPFRGAGGLEVLDSRGRPVEEAAALVRRRLAAAALLDRYYRDAGQFAARITPRPPAPDGRLVIDVDPGPAARIGCLEVRGAEAPQRLGVLEPARPARRGPLRPGRARSPPRRLRGRLPVPPVLRGDASPTPRRRVRTG